MKIKMYQMAFVTMTMMSSAAQSAQVFEAETTVDVELETTQESEALNELPATAAGMERKSLPEHRAEAVDRRLSESFRGGAAVLGAGI